MAKIWCEKCKGGGKLFWQPEEYRMCKTCHGAGYTESEPPKAERINPSAREMIEAGINTVNAMIVNSYTSRMNDSRTGELKGLMFALDCLDKPAEPMVSLKEVSQVVEKAYWHDGEGAYAYMKNWIFEKGREVHE